jgi:hypothetical protein
MPNQLFSARVLHSEPLRYLFLQIYEQSARLCSIVDPFLQRFDGLHTQSK